MEAKSQKAVSATHGGGGGGGGGSGSGGSGSGGSGGGGSGGGGGGSGDSGGGSAHGIICRSAMSGDYFCHSNFAAGDFTCFPNIYFRGLFPNKMLQRCKRPQIRVGIG